MSGLGLLGQGVDLILPANPSSINLALYYNYYEERGDSPAYVNQNLGI
jgi:hypothetical protein